MVKQADALGDEYSTLLIAFSERRLRVSQLVQWSGLPCSTCILSDRANAAKPAVLPKTLPASELPAFSGSEYADALGVALRCTAEAAFDACLTPTKLPAQRQKVLPEAQIDEAAVAAWLATAHPIDELELKQSLRAMGFRTPRETLTRTETSAAREAERLGLRVELKAMGPKFSPENFGRLAKRCDAGHAAVRQAFRDLVQAYKEMRSSDRMRGIVVSESLPQQWALDCTVMRVRKRTLLGLDLLHRDMSVSRVLTSCPISPARAEAIVHQLIQGVSRAPTRRIRGQATLNINQQAVALFICHLAQTASLLTQRLHWVRLDTVAISTEGDGTPVVVDARCG